MSAPGPCILSKANIHPICSFEQIKLWWQAPTTGGTFDSFVISLAGTPVLTINDPTAYSTIITGLTNATEYEYSIQAKNSGTTTLGPSVSWRSVQPGNRTTAPSYMSFTQTLATTTTLNISWTGPTTDSNMGSVKWYVLTAVPSFGNLIKYPIYPSQTSTIISLSSNETYRTNLIAVNDSGYSPVRVGFLKPTTAPMSLWMDIADETTYTVDTFNNISTISTISDKSGCNYTMYQLPPNPFGLTSVLPAVGSTLNGLPTAYFSPPAGITQPTEISSITNFFWVGRQFNQSNNSVFMFGNDTYNDWNGSSNFYMSSNGAAGIQTASTFMFYNGISTLTQFNQTPVIGNMSTFLLSVHGITGNTRFQGLCYDRNSNAGWIGEMGEILCFNSTMTTQQINSVHTYLLNKWQIIPITSSIITSTCVNLPQIVVSGFASGTGSFGIIRSFNGTNWSSYVSYIGGNLYGIAASSNLWIAAQTGTGGGGRIFYSSDLTAWTNSFAPSAQFYYSVATNSQIYLAGGTSRLIYSYNGITWSNSVNGGSLLTPLAFGYNDTMWVAVGNGYKSLIWSMDGINWTYSTNSGSLLGNITSGTAAVVWSSALNLWIAGGAGSILLWSMNGKTWTVSTNGSTLMTTQCFGLACNDSLVVAAGQGTNCLLWSEDGKTWNTSTNGNTIFTTASYSVNWNSTLNIWTAGGQGNSIVATSTDGKTWTKSTLTSTPSSGRIVTSRPTITIAYVASGMTSLLGNIGYSQDGINWVIINNSPFINTTYCYTTIWNGTMWVAGGVGTLAYSMFGIYWVPVVSPPAFTNCYSVTYNNTGVWVAGCSGTNSLLYSTNGTTWLASTNGSSCTTTVYAVAWNGIVFVAGGIGLNALVYSTNGISWKYSINGNSLFTTVYSISYNGTIFVAGGTGATTIAYSSDGITWRNSSIDTTIFSVCNSIFWNGSIFLAGGQGTGEGATNVLAYSSDGIHWTGSVNGNSIFTICTSVSWNTSLSRWVAGGSGTNRLAYSADGINWTVSVNGNSIFTNSIYSVASSSVFVYRRLN
jgi:hypothetical protein